MKESLVDALDLFLQSRLRGVHTCLPGTIEKYYGHDKRKAVVKVGVKLQTAKGDILSIPPIDGVPVVFPSSGKFTLKYPLNKGDGCMIIFSEEGIGAWLKGDTEVNADSLARFALTDAICVPGLWSFKTVPSSTDATIEILDDGTIKVDGLGIELNGNVKKFVTYTELNAALQTFITALNLHTHPTAPTGPISPPTTPMSLDISTSETQTIKTGG